MPASGVFAGWSVAVAALNALLALFGSGPVSAVVFRFGGEVGVGVAPKGIYPFDMKLLVTQGARRAARCVRAVLIASLRAARAAALPTFIRSSRATHTAHLTPCLACQRCMNSISSCWALMMLRARRFNSGSLPYFSSVWAISIAPS
ncbi:hypothetical protein LMG28140_02454 [Paraburkholderia metrosideri]|uniref:Secreted protein n=1 Tax=Paraburkholderia metrosideri TaxID=580937 RepID=A0ABN7HQA7_9BURK|nr:hypothetical protein LMG28140_02454 [Paraburkholderia metrosideri]